MRPVGPHDFAGYHAPSEPTCAITERFTSAIEPAFPDSRVAR